MDPNANLKRARELAESIVALNGSLAVYGDQHVAVWDYAPELAELVLALTDHLAGVYERMQLVRSHSDYAFGVVFTREDFTGGEIPDDFNAGVIEDLMTERGNEYIEDHTRYTELES